MTVTLTHKQKAFLNAHRVGRLATKAGNQIHIVPMCPVFDKGLLYAGSPTPTRKIANIKRDNRVSILIDQYSEDWSRHVAILFTGKARLIERGKEFEYARDLLEAKYAQYKTMFPIKEGESVIIKINPEKSVWWDYAAGENVK
ncbi:MAG: pyridoxamine 5'-phosphate oxidase family protein [Candidatus Bathyarchaeia archaeon]